MGLSFQLFLRFHLLLLSGFPIPSLHAAAHRIGIRVLLSVMQHLQAFVYRAWSSLFDFYFRNEVYFGVVKSQLNVFGLQGRRSLNRYKKKYFCFHSSQANKENQTRRYHVWSLGRRHIWFRPRLPKTRLRSIQSTTLEEHKN